MVREIAAVLRERARWLVWSSGVAVDSGEERGGSAGNAEVMEVMHRWTAHTSEAAWPAAMTQ